MAYLDDLYFTLNIQPSANVPLFVRLSQNENGRRLYFALSGAENTIPSGTTVTITGTKPDGVVYSKTGSITNNVVLINEDVQMTAVAGTWYAKIKLVSGGQTIASARIRFVIDADTVEPGAVPSDSQLEGLLAEAQYYAENARSAAYGSPLVANTVADMTDHTRVYVYTGSETGYTAGHWYYWNGSAWTDGGIYNSVAVNTDITLSLTGVAADAKAVGDELSSINSYNIIKPIEWIDRTARGITWLNNGDGTYSVSGTATNTATNNLIGSSTSFPTGIEAGESYVLRYNGNIVAFNVLIYKDGELLISNTYRRDNVIIEIPSDANGCLFRLFVSNGTTVNETVKPILLTAQSNKELQSRIDVIDNSIDAIDKAVDEIKVNLFDNNSWNILQNATREDRSYNGVSFSWNADGSCTVTGTSTAIAQRFMAGSDTTIPEGITPGKKYILKYDGTNVAFGLTTYFSNDTYDEYYYNDDIIEIEPDVIGVRFRLFVGTGKTVNETVKPILLTAQSNAELGEKIELVNDIIDGLVRLTPSTLNDRISQGDNLNDFVNVGQYIVPTQAIAKSLQNKPIDYGHTGTLTVVNTHNTNHVYQIIMTNGASNIWIRHIRIDEQIFDEWKSIISNSTGSASWQAGGFIVHNPEEENTSMVENVSKYLGRTISSSEAWATRSSGFRTMSSDDIYQMWDGLQEEYSDYIDVGETIGYSYDTNGDNYAPIKAYYIHPKLTYGNNIPISYDELPTIYITAGTHGVEASPVWNLFAIFQRAFQRGTIYSEFLKGIKYRIIPCFSRWSYDHYKRYLAAAYNSDGTTKESAIDLSTGEIYPAYDANRQCVCLDDSNPSYDTLSLYSYAGEAKALTDYMEAHNFSAQSGDSYIDLHNCSYSLGYMTGNKSMVRNAFNLMIDELAKDWLVYSPWKNGDPAYYYNTSTDDHTILHGKILARENIEHSFSWFFGQAYAPFASTLLEVQQVDETSCNKHAIAKGLDVTYRWFKYLTGKVRNE